MWRSALLWMAILFPGSIAAQQDPAPGADAVAPEREAAEAPNQEEKERVATAAIYLLALIVFAGLCLMGLAIFWGYRTRRIARSPLPPARPFDPFWYLRRPKHTSGEDDEPAP